MSGRAKAVPDGKQATDFFALHEGQSSIADHVQLLRSWMSQDTSVALRPRAQTDTLFVPRILPPLRRVKPPATRREMIPYGLGKAECPGSLSDPYVCLASRPCGSI